MQPLQIKPCNNSFGQFVRYLVLLIAWIQQGWFCEDILHHQPGIQSKQ